MAKVVFVEPNITIEENERRIEIVKEVLKKIVNSNRNTNVK